MVTPHEVLLALCGNTLWIARRLLPQETTTARRSVARNQRTEEVTLQRTEWVTLQRTEEVTLQLHLHILHLVEEKDALGHPPLPVSQSIT